MASEERSTSKKETGERPARERILDASLKLFAARGFDATPTKAVADEAGVPSGLIFYYFETKQGLLRTLVDERSFLPRLKGLLEAVKGSDPRAALVEIGTRLLEGVKREENLVRIMFGEFHLHGAAYEGAQALFDESLDLLASYLDGAVGAGRLRPTDTRVLAHLFRSGLLISAIFEQPEDPKAFVERAVDVLLEGLLPEEG